MSQIIVFPPRIDYDDDLEALAYTYLQSQNGRKREWLPIGCVPLQCVLLIDHLDSLCSIVPSMLIESLRCTCKWLRLSLQVGIQ